jgi:hypothetical protein
MARQAPPPCGFAMPAKAYYESTPDPTESRERSTDGRAWQTMTDACRAGVARLRLGCIRGKRARLAELPGAEGAKSLYAMVTPLAEPKEELFRDEAIQSGEPPYPHRPTVPAVTFIAQTSRGNVFNERCGRFE